MFKKCLSGILALIIVFSLLTVFTAAVNAEGSYILGDADGDGEVSIIEVTYVQRYYAHFNIPLSNESLMHADVDGSGEVEIIDATYIQRYLAEMNVKYPIGETIKS